jgi:uncharacterized protein with HEPN domain
MSPRDLVYAGHMLDMARKAVGKTDGLSREAFDADENLRLALTHLVQIIGEAARHKVVHDYLGVDEDIVWQVVTDDLPKRVAALEPLVPRPRRCRRARRPPPAFVFEGSVPPTSSRFTLITKNPILLVGPPGIEPGIVSQSPTSPVAP